MWDSASRGDLEGIWFWASAYVFLVCGYSVIYQIRVRRWANTIGSLHHATVSKFGSTDQNPSEQSYHADTHYTYTIQGKNYSGHRVSPWLMLTNNNLRALLRRQLKGIESTPSGEVKVFYNPKTPKKSYLVLPGKWGIGLTLLLSSLPGIGYLFRYHS